jgi:MFS family permease
VRILPYAGAMIVAATSSAMLVQRFGTKRVATLGMLLFATGLTVAATLTLDTGYGRLAIAFVGMGLGMGFAGAPATESIMRALPPARANVGSAVNDTTRELGGALGVAVVGSIMASLYGDGLPALGVAVEAGGGVADAARAAFLDAMSTAAIVVAVITALGALAAWRHLPPRTDREPAAVPSHAR